MPQNANVRALYWSSRQPEASAATAVALYLHGGTVNSRRPVTRAATTYQRARWLMDAISPGLAQHGIASVQLKHSHRGWNAKHGEPAPLPDARWALDQLRMSHNLPVVLIGHSMGARTGLHVADDPSVVGLVAVAPWFPADESIETLKERSLAVIHGTRDRITSPRESRTVAERSLAVTRSTSYQSMPGLGHYLLSRIPDWNRATRAAVRDIAAGTHQTSI